MVTKEQSRKGRAAYLAWAKQKDARMAKANMAIHQPEHPEDEPGSTVTTAPSF